MQTQNVADRFRQLLNSICNELFEIAFYHSSYQIFHLWCKTVRSPLN